VASLGEVPIREISSQNRDEVVACYEGLALHGDMAGQYNLALLFYYGKFKDKDLSRAAGLFKSAADNGHVLASYNYAAMAEQGEGMEVDYQKARKYYGVAANGGHTASQVIIGQLLELDGDYDQSVEWYEKAIQAQSAEAYFYLGAIHLRGNLGAPDIKKACSYILASERLGFAKAIKFKKNIDAKGVKICQE
jgi:TPR repeat protein